VKSSPCAFSSEQRAIAHARLARERRCTILQYRCDLLNRWSNSRRRSSEGRASSTPMQNRQVTGVFAKLLYVRGVRQSSIATAMCQQNPLTYRNFSPHRSISRSMKHDILEAQRTFEQLASHESTLNKISAAVVSALKAGNKILACGNGGSAAQAQHLVTELVGRYKQNTIASACPRFTSAATPR
jgi:hypothetical protein